ncbi:hypothetical protein F5883DRAFT_504915 [Diaporthe sp. PMI_573]|nr:hypothetical protein F5883DRAFT_504915 [Diaporthaceae sp. PMI_573]
MDLIDLTGDGDDDMAPSHTPAQHIGANALAQFKFSDNRYELHDPSALHSNAVPGPTSRSNKPSASRSMVQLKAIPIKPTKPESSSAKSHRVSDSSLGDLSPSSGTLLDHPSYTPQPSRNGEIHQLAKINPPFQTPFENNWNVEKIKHALFDLSNELDWNHSKLVNYNLRTTALQKAPGRRHISLTAHLADIKLSPLPNERSQDGTMKIYLKTHGSKDTCASSRRKKLAYEVVCIKSDKPRVPGYKFHHVEISRNILTPNTMLKFIPHLRDMKDNEEERYTRWTEELEAMDAQSGFNVTSLNRSDRVRNGLKEEIAAEISLYIDHWVAKLGLDNCSKSTLLRYMATQPDLNDKITPQQKNIMIHRLDEVGSSRATNTAEMFTEAFNRLWKHTELTLKDVLAHDETVEAAVENKKLLKDEKPDSKSKGVQRILEMVESNLLTYTILGCLHCYSHSCEHGEYDRDNQRRPLGVHLIGGFGGLMRQNMAKNPRDPKDSADRAPARCRNSCWHDYRTGNINADVEPWTDAEVALLQGLHAASAARASLCTNLPCLVSTLLGRPCCDVYRKQGQLGLDNYESLYDLGTPVARPPKTKLLDWYDHHRKELKRDWRDHLNAHDFTRLEVKDPCTHIGSCGKGCPCVDAKLLCERFCRCTAEICAYKFTGCACEAEGETCLQSKEGKPCICVQLNRECDPVLCQGCGAFDRADPKNARDAELHSFGCQNVALQRGVSKTVLLGESQIEGCGYGLFTAENIVQDEFVIEYLGELISHDEGVRREARRGNVFDDSKHSSYLFTLLDDEGIWVDAAIYGNLSRYINHASEYDKVGKKLVNTVPQILFVNGDYRIKFKAQRDIKAGEELFFNYGENFPNLTKKLVESQGENTRPKRGDTLRGRGGRGLASRGRGRGSLRVTTNGTKKAPRPVMDEEDEVSSGETIIKDEKDDEDDEDFRPGRTYKPRRGGTASGVRGGRKRKKQATRGWDPDS